MKSADPKKAQKELYQELRAQSWAQLWGEAVPQFNAMPPAERDKNVPVVRAVGVVFMENGDAGEREAVQGWLLKLARDPSEKVRRYALAALPKVGVGETEVIALLKTAANDRERASAAHALEKIGGGGALDVGPNLPERVRQKIQAAHARETDPSALRLEGVLSGFAGLRVHLRGRRGLETVVAEEARELATRTGTFRVRETKPALVVLEPAASFSIRDLLQLRCFGSIGFCVGRGRNPAEWADAISSSTARNIFTAFTTGTIRYRLNFTGKGHQRGAVRALAAEVFALAPEILNDARSVTWTVDITDDGEVELRPNLTPDPRFTYRRRDVPASSHPQIAAGLARLAGRVENDVVWDPFCGSGMELIECGLLGGARELHGTDLSAAALDIARENFTAAGLKNVSTHFVRADFRDYGERLKAGQIGLVITNPPLGMRVPVPNLRELIQDLFDTSARVLRAGGRLVLANPGSKHRVPPSLRLAARHQVDFGGFDCWVECYVQQGGPNRSR